MLVDEDDCDDDDDFDTPATAVAFPPLAFFSLPTVVLVPLSFVEVDAVVTVSPATALAEVFVGFVVALETLSFTLLSLSFVEADDDIGHRL